MKTLTEHSNSGKTQNNTAELLCKANNNNSILSFQPKLPVTHLGDESEQEAGIISEKVMNSPMTMQRKCADCKDEEEKLQRKPLASFIQKMGNDSGMTAADGITQQINSTKGNGSSIDSNIKSFMESRFGTDFSDVKIHTDNAAFKMNKEVNALAFTYGKDIYFNEGNYNTSSDSGRHLLAHELAHVVQQTENSSKIQRGTGDPAPQQSIEPEPQQSIEPPKKETPEQSTEPAPGQNADIMEIAGDPAGKKRFLIAWTIDDGPFGATTSEMQGNNESKTGLGGIVSVTWFIQRNKLTSEEEFTKLKALQDGGGEIAIHSFHPSEDHSTWFPIAKTNEKTGFKASSAYGTPYGSSTEADIMNDLKNFKTELNTHGINVKFVRLPGGLISELNTYARILGYNDTDADYIAKNVIAGKTVSSKGDNAVKIETDFKTLKATLSELDLLEWSGTADPSKIAYQSWEAETSGVASRADNTTTVVSPARAPLSVEKKDNPGKFERLVDGMKDGDVRSLVILAHDKTTEDSVAVKEDKLQMETYASKHGTKIEYYTMSKLFNIVTKQDIATFDVKY